MIKEKGNNMSEKSLLIEILERVSKMEPSLDLLKNVIHGNGKEGLITTIAKMREVEALLIKSVADFNTSFEKHLRESKEYHEKKRGDLKWWVVLTVAIIVPLITKYYL